jgi:mRNA interferase MazF
MKRGEIWWASLPSLTGSGPGFRRPVIVIQANSFSESRIGTVVVAIVTTNLTIGGAPGNVRLGKADSGLSKPSVVNVSQLFTIDRSLLTERVRALPSQSMHQVEAGLRLVLSL